ncbi:hypothetical protein XA68_18465 [Ophiocordyceps unilateralis]|uniref:Uncharacterized protein n=1 Tax=Ophiocordyceps unilateralis TaxID=268505 RepID=A0A2A9PJA8_OPHUN|nr:hypothetical protein XA68_18465 [Ophiocordyceps unilateralis]
MAATGSRDDDDDDDDDDEGYSSASSSSPAAAAADRFLWVDVAKNVGLRFRVGPAMTPLPGPDADADEEEPSVTYTLVYQELLVRTCTLLVAMEGAELAHDAALGVLMVQFPSTVS